MTDKERLREKVTGALSDEQLERREREGWRLVSVEWERTAPADSTSGGRLMEEIPFGMRVSEDRKHLEEEPSELEALVLMLELIADDRALSEVADNLNVHGHRMRSGDEWTQTAVFEMLPRLIEVAPQIFASEHWKARRATAGVQRLMG